MVQQFEAVPHLETESFSAVALPYRDEAVRLYLFVPKEGHSVRNLVAQLEAKRWAQWLEQFKPVSFLVRQKAKIVVNEEGTEAVGAATIIILRSD